MFTRVLAMELLTGASTPIVSAGAELMTGYPIQPSRAVRQICKILQLPTRTRMGGAVSLDHFRNNRDAPMVSTRETCWTKLNVNPDRPSERCRRSVPDPGPVGTLGRGRPRTSATPQSRWNSHDLDRASRQWPRTHPHGRVTGARPVGQRSDPEGQHQRPSARVPSGAVEDQRHSDSSTVMLSGPSRKTSLRCGNSSISARRRTPLASSSASVAFRSATAKPK
jgi:hypothetical protein